MPPWKSFLLHAYLVGTAPGRWLARRAAAWRGRSPIVVIVYHRVADDGASEWTCPARLFARQVRWLASRFEMVSLGEAQRRLRVGDSPRPAVHITFDDGYSENCRDAVPLLVKMGVPCTYFVASRNVLTGEPFAHDTALGHAHAPNTPEQLRAMAGAGIEIGSHTRTHADLGRVTDPARLDEELAVSREELEAVTGRPVRYFAFPFGQRVNLSEAAFRAARRAGYEAACSAYGGYNFPGGDPFHVQRFCADESFVRLKNHATIDPRKTFSRAMGPL